MLSQLLEAVQLQTQIWSAWAPLDSRLSADSEAKRAVLFHDFLTNHPSTAADRSCVPGHLTGSALVVDHTFLQVLLTHHRKLNLWLQLGGHADSDWDLGAVAKREVEEESGLAAFKPLLFSTSGGAWLFVPFDLDCHEIPENPKNPCHKHYDVRFLIIADPLDKVLVSDESHDVRWFPIDEARKLTTEESMHRQFDKVEFLRNHPSFSSVGPK